MIDSPRWTAQSVPTHAGVRAVGCINLDLDKLQRWIARQDDQNDQLREFPVIMSASAAVPGQAAVVDRAR